MWYLRLLYVCGQKKHKKPGTTPGFFVCGTGFDAEARNYT